MEDEPMLPRLHQNRTVYVIIEVMPVFRSNINVLAVFSNRHNAVSYMNSRSFGRTLLIYESELDPEYGSAIFNMHPEYIN